MKEYFFRDRTKGRSLTSKIILLVEFLLVLNITSTFSSTLSFAASSNEDSNLTAITAYRMLTEGDDEDVRTKKTTSTTTTNTTNATNAKSGAGGTQAKTFLWTGPIKGKVGPNTSNFNRLASQTWGVRNQYPGPVKPYSKTNPGFKGPKGESYGIEIEFGDTKIKPRSPNTKNVRFYTDFGQKGIANSGVDRAEVHIRTTLQSLGVEEGTTLWFGWSEYYTHLDKSRRATILQFRNQPSVRILKERGFTAGQITKIKNGGYIKGSPASAMEVVPVGNNLHYNFVVRKGQPKNWKIPKNQEHITSSPIETGKWYDFVVQMKYSQNSDGRFRVWMFDPEKDSGYKVSDKPEWDFKGPTMYNYPKNYSLPITSPEVRFGVYRHYAKNVKNMPNKERYMVKYAGPMRFWKGGSNEGFNQVMPR